MPRPLTLLSGALLLVSSAAFADPETAPSAEPATSPHPGLLDPSLAVETAPDRYEAHFETTKGVFVVDVHREWAPLGADRFYNLVKIGFYDDVAFFRVVPGFVAQTGLSSTVEVNEAWRAAKILDEPVTQSNSRSYVSFATLAQNSRTTQFFINFGDNSSLDELGFSPFGVVIQGMEEVVDALYDGYGEAPPVGKGPKQESIRAMGHMYYEFSFPELDFIKTARVVEPSAPTAPAEPTP